MADIFDLFRKIGSGGEQTRLPVTHLVVGLGNPGEKYLFTRHNAGFLTIDYLSQRLGVKVTTLKFHALVGEATMAGRRVLLMKPQTMMNASGEAVRPACDFYKIPPENVIVISDDISLDAGRLRVRESGSAGGHNGLKSIIAHLGSENFPRVKMGVGQKPTPDYDLADWVLSNFSKEEQKALFATFGVAFDGIGKLLEGRADDAKQICNGFRYTEGQNK